MRTGLKVEFGYYPPYLFEFRDGMRKEGLIIKSHNILKDRLKMVALNRST